MARRILRFDQRILLLAITAGLPATLVALVLLWTGTYSPRTQWTVTVLLVMIWIGGSLAVRRRVVHPLQTLADLLGALRDRDFSFRARAPGGRPSANDPLDAVMFEVNELASTLHDQRLDAMEAGALLRTVMVEIDVAVFTFDGLQTLRLVNRAGERLLGQSAEQLMGSTARDIGLATFLAGEVPRIEQVVFPGASGRWEVRRTTFRQEGRPHQLLVLADVSRPLRDEERQAWQRLIRVISHEINNSLAPIKSIAGSLESMMDRASLPPDWQDDMRRGLAVIATRSDALGRFTASYATLAKLPKPRRVNVRVLDLVRRVVGLETRLGIEILEGPDIELHADPDQLEQLLINLVQNAVDAALERGGRVTAGWALEGSFVLWVDDEGAGLPGEANLFVPFFTTKPGGSGIGLVLSRQIAEAHGGSLALENRTDRSGCRAMLRLPLIGADARA